MSGPPSMDTERSRRLHAARVAAVATAVVMVVYVVAVVAFSFLVSHRLTEEMDARLAAQLTQAARPTFVVPGATGGHDRDNDDSPTFVWSVSAAGVPTASSADAPPLPVRTWDAGVPETVEIAGTPYRVAAAESGTGWLVAGESAAQLSRVSDALFVPELLLGAALLVVTFVGALVIGLRASAPLELIHRRQVEFTADASHELRTPLSVIDAEVALALSRPRTAAEHEAVLRRIADEGVRLRRIVEDLLWLARVDDGQAPVHVRTGVDLATVAAACADRFQPVAAGRGVTLGVTAPGPDAARINADPEWIDRLVGVLVDNACKFAGDGGRVDVRVVGSGGRVALQVDDSGPGIPPEQRSLVFDRFHRATDQSSGTGLGLAIADSVVRASHGSWAVTDSPLGGARMEVSWRRAAARRSEPEAARTSDDRRPAGDAPAPQAGLPSPSNRGQGA